MFDKARIKLTAWYLLIIMMVSAFFSIVIYQMLSSEVERVAHMQRTRIERKFLRDKMFMGLEMDPLYAPPLTDEDIELVTDVKNRLIINLLVINGIILISSGGMGYILAGKTLKPIKRMVDEQNRFVGDASHEFRTPLTSLKTAMEVFIRSKDATLNEAKTLIQENMLEVNKLQHLAEDLLNLAQYQEFQKKLHLVSTNLKFLVTSAFEKVRKLADDKRIHLVYVGRDDSIVLDRGKIVDVLVILLDNAIKYSAHGKAIIVDSHLSNEWVSISVKDEGMGIEAKDHPHIFDRFYRSDSARSKSSTGGFGLGLSIAKQIIDLHAGTISVESELGKGATFVIRIPKRRSNDS